MNTAEILKRSDSDIYTKNIKSSDVDLFNIVKQVCELTGSSYDAAATALFDCNYDIERAVNKIFENPLQTIGETDPIINAWKEVAKPKKKSIISEIVSKETNLQTEMPYYNNTVKNDLKDTTDVNQRSNRGSGRGRGRNIRSSGRVFDNNNETITRNTSRGRGRRPPIRGASNRGRQRANYNTDMSYCDTAIEAESDNNYFAEEVDNQGRSANEWLSDDGETEFVSNANTDVVAPVESLKVDDPPNPVEIVSKCKNMDGVFGDFSRTKAPQPSTIVPTEAVKLLTSSGVISNPSRTNFKFGLDFTEYCDGNVQKISSTRVKEDYRKVHIDEDDVIRIQVSQDGFNRVQQKSQIDDNKQTRKSHSDDNHSTRKPHNLEVYDLSTNRTPIDSHEQSFVSSAPIMQHQQPSNASMNLTIIDPSYVKSAAQCLQDPTFTTTMMQPPPGISNAHIIQQLHNSQQQYLSLMNLQTGQSIFDLADIAASSSNQSAPAINADTQVHSVDSKDFQPKSVIATSVAQPVHTSKQSAEHDHAAIVNAMQMNSLCCFPQMYMNNYGNFMPAVPSGHNSSGHCTTGQSIDISQSSVNKPLFTHPMHGNYGQEEFNDSVKFDEGPSQGGGKLKYARGPNFGNYGSGSKDEDDNKPKLVSGGSQQQHQSLNRQSGLRSGQQSITNDPRYLAFQHSGHTYPGNMYNCVTAPGPHPSAQHPYAMTHQAGGMAQLHLMQQQMHNFPQPYQFQEHLMTSMVSNANNRNGSGSNGNQTRNSRSNNALWHPSN